jgi:Arc/MetJ-type ribon-helix-helix transcriptional regulator
MKTISVSLGEQLNDFIVGEIASGKYQNADEIINHALQLLVDVRNIQTNTDSWSKKQKAIKVKTPQRPIDVYDALPEMKIELIDGKIIWGGQPIKPDTEFEKTIAEVINRFMEQPSADIILFAAYLTECINLYNNTVYGNE